MAYSIQFTISDNTPEALALEAITSRENITPEEAILRILRREPIISPDLPKDHYQTLFGAGKGMSSLTTREEVDKYISDLRNEW